MEFDPSLLGNCAVVTVDSKASARAFSRELREHYGSSEDQSAWDDIDELADVVASASPRTPGRTLFKAMGIGLGDLAIAAFCYEQAQINQLGQNLPTPSRSNPRLRSSLVRS